MRRFKPEGRGRPAEEPAGRNESRNGFPDIVLVCNPLIRKTLKLVMAKLEDIRLQASVEGVLPNCQVTVVSVQWFGSEALELTYKDPSGRVANELLYRHDEPRLKIVEHGRPWSFDGDGNIFRLVSEAHRIRLAHLFDPVLAVHTSLVEPLPHQITAVYESMLS